MAQPLILPPLQTFDEIMAKQRREAAAWLQLADRIDAMEAEKAAERAEINRRWNRAVADALIARAWAKDAA